MEKQLKQLKQQGRLIPSTKYGGEARHFQICFQILHSVKPLSGRHVLIIIKVIVSTEGNQGEIPTDGDFQKTSPAERMDLFEFNNILSSSLLRCIFTNSVLSVVWQEVSALAWQFIGELSSFCVSQMSLCTGNRRKGKERVQKWLIPRSRRVPAVSGGGLHPASSCSREELLSKRF